MSLLFFSEYTPLLNPRQAMAKSLALLKALLVRGQLTSFLSSVFRSMLYDTMFILQIGFKNIKQHLLPITKCRADILYISRRSKPARGAEIEETQSVP